MLGSVTFNVDKKSIASSLSGYQPSVAVKDLTKKVKEAYEEGNTIQNYAFPEFNNKSLIQRMNEDQRAWLSWSPSPLSGEDEWRWTGVRPITRNKVISTAAHLTAQLLVPNVFAQNDFDKEDRDAAYVMRELIEYNIRRSNYETAFLFGVISGLVNPVSYFKVDYCRAWQESWVNGKKEMVIDEVFDGFQHSLIAPEDVLFGNAYQYDIQKQDWLIQRKRISYGEAESKWGLHPNFTYVHPGKMTIFHSDTSLFYDVEDINDNLVEEVCFKHRRSDTEAYFLNGIYVSGPNPDYNPFIHRTNKDRPKYNVVKFGYEPIDAMRFFGYKSLVAKMSNDQESTDREWQMYFDASFLATFPPTISMGAGKIDKSVVRPAVNTELGENAKITPLQIVNPSAALAALRESERSLIESSQDPQLAGTQQGPQKTARESILLQQNAQTNMGIPVKMIGTMVKEIGALLIDDIIRFQTIGEVGEIAGQMTYRSFIVDGKVKEGKNKSVYIKFTDRFAGREMSEEEKDMEGYKLMEEAGDDKELFEVNPSLFARMQYLVTVDADQMLAKNEAFERAFKLETYDRAIANPLIMNDPEALQKITRDFLLEPLLKGEAAQYLPNIQKVAQTLTPSSTPTKNKGQDLSSRLMRSVAMEQA